MCNNKNQGLIAYYILTLAGTCTFNSNDSKFFPLNQKWGGGGGGRGWRLLLLVLLVIIL